MGLSDIFKNIVKWFKNLFGKGDSPVIPVDRQPERIIKAEDELHKKRNDINEKIDAFQNEIVNGFIQDFEQDVKQFNKLLQWEDASVSIDSSFNYARFKVQCKKLINDISQNIKDILDSEYTVSSCSNIISITNFVTRNQKWKEFNDRVEKRVKEQVYNNIENFCNETLKTIYEICDKNIISQQNLVSMECNDLEKYRNEANDKETYISNILCSIANAKILMDLTNICNDKYYFKDFTQE